MSEQLPERVWLSEIGLYHVMAHGGSGDVLMSDNASRVSFKPYIRADIADDLLAALKRIEAYGNDGVCPYGCDTPDIARQAIAKAKGASNE